MGSAFEGDNFEFVAPQPLGLGSRAHPSSISADDNHPLRHSDHRPRKRGCTQTHPRLIPYEQPSFRQTAHFRRSELGGSGANDRPAPP
jgi:hypothetical protein